MGWVAGLEFTDVNYSAVVSGSFIMPEWPAIACSIECCPSHCQQLNYVYKCTVCMAGQLLTDSIKPGWRAGEGG
jgi:hypothetical protein